MTPWIRVICRVGLEEELRELSFSEAPKIAVRPPGPKSLELLKKQAELETRSLIYPKSFQIAIDAARGATIRDLDGNYYVDLIAGIAVINAGHNNPHVLKAVSEQLERYWHWVSEVPSEARIRFLEKVHSILPPGLRGNAKLMTSVTGADACEAAMALARWVTGRPAIMAFEGAYHGIHHGAVMATAKRDLLRFAGVPAINVIRLPYPYFYRFPFKARDEEECGYAVLEYTEHLLKDPYTGVGDVAAIMVEPVQGEGGYIVPPKNFLKGLREICDRYGLLLIDDEVQAGVGRTGKWWAVEHFGVTPDIMCISKAIGGGLPISLIAYRKELDEKVEEMFHLGTYRANPLGMAAGTAVIEFIESRGLLERTLELGGYALKRFKEMEDRYGVVGDVRGLGFMIGVELVKDKATKEPGKELALRVRKELFERGVLMHLCGHFSNVMRFMPPLVLTKEHLDTAIDIFEQVTREVSKG